MKKLIKNIFIVFAKLVAFLISPFLVKSLKSIINRIYTQYIIKQFKIYGKNPIIKFSLTSIYGLKYVSVGDDFYSASGLILEAYDRHLDSIFNPKVIIGNNVRINFDCHIACVNKVVIGNNVLIASKVFISDHFHGETSIDSLNLPPNSRKVISKGPVIIEDNVWIGEGVAIMPNVRIGRNAIIGANSVVTKDVPENSVVGGNPARIIKFLNDNN